MSIRNSAESRGLRLRSAILIAVLIAMTLGAARAARAGGEPADGALDPSFAGGGQVVLNAGLSGNYSVAVTLEAPDGALVVVARRLLNPGGKAWVWFRVTDNGAAAVCPFVPPGATDLTERPMAAFDGDGRLVLAGSVTLAASDLVGGAVRFLYPACVPDSSFGAGGFQVIDPTVAFEVMTALAIDPHDPLNRLFLAGSYVSPGIADTLVVSLHEDGSPRVGEFGANGWVRIDTMLLQRTELPIALALQPDGKPVVAGLLTPEFGFPAQMFVQRLLPGGGRDSSFGAPVDEGAVLVSLAPDGFAGVGFALDVATGRIALAGQTSVVGELGEAAIAMLLPNGDPDLEFNFDGFKIFDLAGSATSGLVGVVFDGLGRLVVGGQSRAEQTGSDYQFAAARLFADGQLDMSFGAHGSVVIPFDLGNPPSDQGKAFTLQAGRPVVAGDIFDADDSYKPGIARLANALLFADGFEGGVTAAWSVALP